MKRAFLIQAGASAADLCDPVLQRGQTLRAFMGVVTYFSSGTTFTVQARYEADVVKDLSCAPETSKVACVHPRTPSDLTTPQ